ncbi:Arm DNA-binding domain-containing protein [Novosphingobium sp. AAP83]|uniref:Arm DNA-binding domain-containing protein n=1 Tax=Novosphingobium sp. AAP83 TaxID=1523425 RepID=UPI0009ECC4FA
MLGIVGNLSATTLRGPLAKGRYHDGDGLFLSVTSKGARSWICRVQKNGRRRDIGIDSAKKITLSQARQRAAEIRTLVEAGIDPVLHRKRA